MADVDLVGYMHRAGGVDRVAGVLSEFGDEMGPKRLVEACASASVLWSQRLGYLLEHVGAGERAVLLKADVRQRTRNFTTLLPGASADDAPRSKECARPSASTTPVRSLARSAPKVKTSQTSSPENLVRSMPPA